MIDAEAVLRYSHVIESNVYDETIGYNIYENDHRMSPDEVCAKLALRAASQARAEAPEASLAHNIRERCIRMIDDGYTSPEEQQPFFPDVPRSILDAVFAEPFIAALAPAGEVKHE